MNFIENLILDFQSHWWLYLSMPVVAAIIGYTTKLVAIKMMFEPIEFLGIKPIGWQGIIPRKAARMATIACETMTARLISPREIFAKLDPYGISKEIQQPMLVLVEKIVETVMNHYEPDFWNSMPIVARQVLITKVQMDAPAKVRQVMADMQENIDEVFDLKDMVVTNLTRDKRLLNRMFQEAGDKEFKFIAHSGIYFGFTIGIIQMFAWMLTKSTYVMPVFGLFTGWFTDWLALKMVFNPKKRTKYPGIFPWQGLFIKRRKEVAAAYAKLIADEILTPRNMMNAILTGPLSDNLFELIQKHVKEMVDEQSGVLKPMVVFAVGTEKYNAMKESVVAELMVALPDTLRHVEQYAHDALDICNLLTSKMQELTEEEFEGLLRPAFQQDEWILITVGAVLGFLVGELQVFLVTH